MRPISDTIARLSRIKHSRPDIAPLHSHLSDVSDFGSNPGRLRGRFFIPSRLPSNAPLVVVLHGCLQTAASYDHGSGWSKLAAENGFAVLYPEQQRENNPNLCFNWFLRDDTRSGAGELYSIRQMIDRMVADHRLDPRRVYVTGLSAGGAMAAALLANYPEAFAGGAIIAGLAYGVADSIPSAFDRMRGYGLPAAERLEALMKGASNHAGPWPRISIWHGSDDHTVAIANAAAILDQWRSVHRLTDRASTRTTSDKTVHQTWFNDNGEAVFEQRIVRGMGHGTPIDAAGGYGEPGPFVFDVGVSSTREIAAFWGIIRQHGAAIELQSSVERKPVTQSITLPVRTRANACSEQTGQAQSASKAGVLQVIEDALRRAGLMR